MCGFSGPVWGQRAGEGDLIGCTRCVVSVARFGDSELVRVSSMAVRALWFQWPGLGTASW